MKTSKTLKPFNQHIEAIDFLSLIKDMDSISCVEEPIHPYINEFKNMWSEHLTRGVVRDPLILAPNIKDQNFSLEYKIGEYNTISTFSIGAINFLIQNKQLQVAQVFLDTIRNDIHFTETGNRILDSDYTKSPILAVVMPSNIGTNYSFYEIIDGNHRVSAANIPITLVQNLFLPPSAFATGNDWKLYHIVQGFLVLATGSTDAAQYIIGLHGQLEYFYPIQNPTAD